MANIYDTANQLEQEIRELEQFQDLSDSFAELKKDEKAYLLFKEFQNFQQELQQKMSQGEDMTDDDAQKAQDLAQKVQQEPLINDLMQKEQVFSTTVNELNKIIMTPLRELYES
ncbi:MAG: YlbF family regulator [Tetragenococcus sp.]|nr:YlbF family regulator [Tetragenococcus sp.]